MTVSREALHLLRRGNAQNTKAVANHAPGHHDEGETGRGKCGLLSNNAAFIVKRMECGRQLMAVACDALRSVFRCSTLDLLRIGSELLDECRLRLIRQAFQLRPI